MKYSASLEPVVVVGEALRLPGNINTSKSFYQALLDRRTDILEPIPLDRWDNASFYDSSNTHEQGHITFQKAGFIDLKRYDNAFFGISAAEAHYVAPAARLALEVSVDALEDANIPLSSIKGTDMGVFVAVPSPSDYELLLFAEGGWKEYTRYTGTGNASSTISGRLSYFLNLHGPSLSIDTACSGGMVALDSAVKHIQGGLCETAIVCAVNTHLWPGHFLFISANQMASPHGRCATYTSEADGYVPSEGIVTHILKTLSAAQRDGDHILGIVRSTAVLHNGRSQGLVAPSLTAQVKLQRLLLKQADILPSDIDFVESHGTGTSLGDKIEIQAINEVFAMSHTETRPLVIGASKTVFGHTETTAGSVGVAKALQSLRTGVIPGLAHLREDNLSPLIDTSISPLIIPYEPYRLAADDQDYPRPVRALTLAYGFGGTISGVVLEKYQPSLKDAPAIPSMNHVPLLGTGMPHLFVLSAKTPKALGDYIEKYLDFCRSSRAEDLQHICYTTCVGRTHYRYRFSCVVYSIQELIGRLERAYSGPLADFLPIKPYPYLVFAFPGQGTQYQGMARLVAESNQVFHNYLTEAAAAASSQIGVDILPILLDGEATDRYVATTAVDYNVSEVCIFVFQYAMVEWMKSIGLQPQGVLTHSLGEIAAAVTAGMFTFQMGLEFTLARSQYLRASPERPGAMASVAADYKTIQDILQSMNVLEHVSVAAFNGLKRHVVSGDVAEIDNVVDVCLSRGIDCRKLPVEQAFHSHLVEPALDSIRCWINAHEKDIRHPSVDYYSSVAGTLLPLSGRCLADYWTAHARKPVRFLEAAQTLSRKSPIVVDLGPQPVISVLLREVPGFECASVADMTSRRGRRPDYAILSTFAALYQQGVTPDFCRFYEGRPESYRKCKLPTYPWQKQVFYPPAIPSLQTKMIETKDPGSTTKAYTFDSPLQEILRDHSYKSSPLVPTAAFCLMALTGERNTDVVRRVVDLSVLKPLVLGSTRDNTVLYCENGQEYTITAKQDAVVETFCKGAVRTRNLTHTPSLPLNTPTAPLAVIDAATFYSTLESSQITFGPTFRNIRRVDIWDDHADGHIELLQATSNKHDLLRQLDACLQIFSNLPSTDSEFKDGAFLPAALVGLQLRTYTWPSRIICRYTLPVTAFNGSHQMSTSFTVTSELGELLATCDKYIVTWIYLNIPLAPTQTGVYRIDHSYRTVWVEQKLNDLPHHPPTENVIYLGRNQSLRAALEEGTAWTTLLSAISTELRSSLVPTTVFDVTSAEKDKPMILDGIWQLTKSVEKLVLVFDMSPPPNTEFSSSHTHACCLKLLDILKFISENQLAPNFSAIFFTTNALQVLPEDVNVSLDADLSNLCDADLAGSMIHGMLRVLRREIGANSQHFWALDLPELPVVDLCAILRAEIRSRDAGYSSPVIYRHSKQTITRLEARLKCDQIPQMPSSPRFAGAAVIVGLGEIGIAIAEGLIQAGCTAVVFLSRKSETDEPVKSVMSDIRARYSQTALHYCTADVTSFQSTKRALAVARTLAGAGSLEMLVHTAGILQDSAIKNTTNDRFEAVIRPKAWGAWNLHRACDDLSLPVKYFVMLSSVSVPVGTPGQVSYVAANAFQDALATYRTQLKPSCQSLSIQLGPWKSRFMEGKFFEGGPLSIFDAKDGVPLVLRAIASKKGVQVLAKFNTGSMRHIPPFSVDPLFADIILDNGTPDEKWTKVTDPLPEAEVAKRLIPLLREVLGMKEADVLDLTEPLSTLGLDSITFTRFRAGLINTFKIDIAISLADVGERSAEEVIQIISRGTAGA